MYRIAVTGALGHIGSALIHQMPPNFCSNVLLIDNLLTQRYSTLFHMPGTTAFRFVQADVCETSLEPLFEEMDAVIHLAAITNAAASFDIQEQVEHVNFQGTRRVAQACLKTGCRMLFLSTTSVYGTTEKTVDENCSVDELQPQSPYAQSKFRAEQMLADLGKDGLKYIACRFGTIFGASIGMRFHTAVNKFIWQACLGEPLTVWRTAYDQKRPYLDLTDAIRAMEFIIRQDLFDNQIYNVLTQNITVRQVVEAIKRVVPDTQVELVDSRIMNQLSYEVLCDKFQSRGFEFKGDLDRAIRQTASLLAGVRPGAVVAQPADPS